MKPVECEWRDEDSGLLYRAQVVGYSPPQAAVGFAGEVELDLEEVELPDGTVLRLDDWHDRHVGRDLRSVLYTDRVRNALMDAGEEAAKAQPWRFEDEESARRSA